ncbi:hypothetical protein VB779_09365 [Haloarculaceae archaeon H-GB11]|nr:hypothetical protein [Haloarculaceae archaeon H-GB11]
MSNSDSFSLTRENGTAIDVGSLLTVFAGIVTTAFGTSYASLIESLFTTFITGPLTTMQAFIEEYTDIYALPGKAAGRAWDGFTSVTASAEFLAYPVAALIVVGLAYALWKG